MTTYTIRLKCYRFPFFYFSTAGAEKVDFFASASSHIPGQRLQSY